jgi:hypothetical protein
MVQSIKLRFESHYGLSTIYIPESQDALVTGFVSAKLHLIDYSEVSVYLKLTDRALGSRA